LLKDFSNKPQVRKYFMSENTPVIAIVGRPNVGKSALFNAILQRRISIVHEQSGVTRDRVAAPGSFNDHSFLLVDTGGLGIQNGQKKNVDLFDGMIREQVEEVIADAELLIWVVNCQDGITPQDQEVGAFLHKTGKKVIVCANKADNTNVAENVAMQFTALGYEDILPTSCTHTSGIKNLMIAVVKQIPKVGLAEKEEVEPLKIAVIGKPNVGKSSFVNRISGLDRMMVSDIAGTTRDAVDLSVTLKKDDESLLITLIDTAGMRRKKQIDTVVEFFSSNRTEQAIRKSDLVLFIMDAENPCTTQERHIGRLVVDAHKACIILANKWDLVSPTGKKPQDLESEIYRDMPFLRHVPVHTISALNGYNFKGIFDILQHVRKQMQIMIPTGILNQFIQDVLMRNPPTSKGTKRFKIYYGTMKFNPPPKFVLFVNNKKLCPANYLQFLENQLRDAFFPTAGLPILLELRERTRMKDAAPARQTAAGVQRKRQSLSTGNKRRSNRSKGYTK